MIAHRLSTVAGVDQIYVIEDGQITESGKSRELLEKGGVFSRMWQDYQTSVQWKVAKEVHNMIKRLQKRYALSEQGVKDLVKGCLACVLQNLSFMFPVGLLYF